MADAGRAGDFKWLAAAPVLIGALICCGVLGCGGAITGFVFWMISLTGIDHLSDDEIRAGRPCTATVLEMEDTNISYNRRRVYEFTLRVRPEDGAAVYEATVRDTLTPLESGRMSNGETEYRCVIDKDDSSRVEVFW
ncbi:hypothetical protein K1W54_25605 [Micromonospora sp. CPCC 205371]|nr:hypothetical protein [Micromonospora sp. CPCC 205371]